MPTPKRPDWDQDPDLPELEEIEEIEAREAAKMTMAGAGGEGGGTGYIKVGPESEHYIQCGQEVNLQGG